jgi:hypothetical protein
MCLLCAAEGTTTIEAEAEVAEVEAHAGLDSNEEALHARILEKRQRRTAPKEEEEAGDGSGSSDSEHIRLDLYCVFDPYFRNKDDKGKGRHG